MAPTPAPHLQHPTSPQVNTAVSRAIIVTPLHLQAPTGKASPSTASKEDTAVEDTTSTKPHHNTNTTSTAAEATISIHPSINSREDTGVLDNTASLSRVITANKLDMAGLVMDRHQTLLPANTAITLHMAALGTMTITSITSMEARHSIQDLLNSSRVTEALPNTARVMVERRSQDGSSCAQLSPAISVKVALFGDSSVDVGLRKQRYTVGRFAYLAFWASMIGHYACLCGDTFMTPTHSTLAFLAHFLFFSSCLFCYRFTSEFPLLHALKVEYQCGISNSVLTNLSHMVVVAQGSARID